MYLSTLKKKCPHYSKLCLCSRETYFFVLKLEAFSILLCWGRRHSFVGIYKNTLILYFLYFPFFHHSTSHNSLIWINATQVLLSLSSSLLDLVPYWSESALGSQGQFLEMSALDTVMDDWNDIIQLLISLILLVPRFLSPSLKFTWFWVSDLWRKGLWAHCDGLGS